MMSTQHYIVKTPIKGLSALTGETTPLDAEDKDTRALLDCGAIILAEALSEAEASPNTRPDDADALQQALINAIEQMRMDDPDKGNEHWWCQDGMPEVRALAQRLGFDIRARERTRAWRALDEQAGV